MSVVELPILKTISPLLPVTAAPVVNDILPLAPEDVVPVLKVMMPVAPVFPEFTDRTTIEPDVPTLPIPDAIENRPPVKG